MQPNIHTLVKLTKRYKIYLLLLFGTLALLIASFSFTDAVCLFSGSVTDIVLEPAQGSC